MKLSNIHSIDELLKTAAIDDIPKDIWDEMQANMEFLKEESEGAYEYDPGGYSTVDDYGTTYYEPDNLTNFYFKVVLKTSVSLKFLADALEDSEIIDATFAYDTMKRDSSKIPPTMFVFLKNEFADGILKEEILEIASEIVPNPYPEEFTDSESLDNVMEETNSKLVVVPEITVDGETINIKLTGTSYDPDDIPDEIKIQE